MKSCYECCCVDSVDNPILGIEDSNGIVEEWICLECFSQRSDEDAHPYD